MGYKIEQVIWNVEQMKYISHFTFHVVQCVPQHFEHTHIERVTEGFVVEVDSRIRLQGKKGQKGENKYYLTDNTLKKKYW